MGKEKDQAPGMVSEGSWSDYVLVNLIIQVWAYTYFLFVAKYNSKCFLFYHFNMKTEHYLVAITRSTISESQFRAWIFEYKS